MCLNWKTIHTDNNVGIDHWLIIATTGFQDFHTAVNTCHWHIPRCRKNWNEILLFKNHFKYTRKNSRMLKSHTLHTSRLAKQSRRGFQTCVQAAVASSRAGCHTSLRARKSKSEMLYRSGLWNGLIYTFFKRYIFWSLVFFVLKNTISVDNGRLQTVHFAKQFRSYKWLIDWHASSAWAAADGQTRGSRAAVPVPGLRRGHSHFMTGPRERAGESRGALSPSAPLHRASALSSLSLLPGSNPEQNKQHYR